MPHTSLAMKTITDPLTALDAQRAGKLWAHLAGCEPVRTTGLLARPDGASVSVRIADEDVVVRLRREDALLVDEESDLEYERTRVRRMSQRKPQSERDQAKRRRSIRKRVAEGGRSPQPKMVGDDWTFRAKEKK